jgi:tRNA-binding protein
MSTDIIAWDDFARVDIRAGTIVRVEPFPEARKPSYKVWIDFGPLGVKKSSAQITALYAEEDLIGTQIIAVINFSPRQVGPFMSEVLITGFINEDGGVVLSRPERPVPNGSKLA